MHECFKNYKVINFSAEHKKRKRKWMLKFSKAPINRMHHWWNIHRSVVGLEMEVAVVSIWYLHTYTLYQEIISCDLWKTLKAKRKSCANKTNDWHVLPNICLSVWLQYYKNDSQGLSSSLTLEDLIYEKMMLKSFSFPLLTWRFFSFPVCIWSWLNSRWLTRRQLDASYTVGQSNRNAFFGSKL